MNDRNSVIQQIQESLGSEPSVAERIYESMQLNGAIIHEASGPRLPDDIDLTAEYRKVFPVTAKEILRDVAASWAGVKFRRIKEQP
jgi:transcriptional regulator of met regulon